MAMADYNMGRPEGGRRFKVLRDGLANGHGRLNYRDTAGHGVQDAGRLARRRADREAVAQGMHDWAEWEAA